MSLSLPRSSRFNLIMVVVLLVAGGIGAGVLFSHPSSANAAPSFAVAPYVDLTNSQERMVDKAIKQAKLGAFTAAFVIGAGCTAIWGDTLPVTNDPTVSGDIARARSEGAQVIISFGGSGGVELAQSCTSLSALTAAYQSVIRTYHVTHLDFDVEGGAIGDPSSINRRYQAINRLRAANSGLVISVTIPVLQTGLDADGVNFIKAAAANHTKLDIVNIMAMDYYQGSNNMGANAIAAAQHTLSQLKTVFSGASYHMLGITPMIGRNDDAAEIFTEANAKSLVAFAHTNHVGRLAFWSIDRDQPCSGGSSGSASPVCSGVSQKALDFTRIFVA
jgi:hypothetical protein